MAPFTWLMIGFMAVAISVGASARNLDVGKAEYRSSCAACHGIDAKGDGPVAQQLKTRPPDLTVLARNNDGVFPYEKVYETIDGRHMARSHGTRAMPVWGYRIGPTHAYRYRNRMFAVVDYLKSIQEK
jgi:mono/diheme cytochrome c family protein